ncbi:MAG: two component, sigma54 specific, transcriptional regulator, Fis family [Ignavibacteria bacterium]|nr:two component, sigma54 specific, transcriptional regulator, Fis family [Ignavibacteria bacterium]
MSKSKKDNSILIVDDSHDLLEIMHRQLTTKGYAIFTATGVLEAIKVLESTSIDLVITDWKMPKYSGLDLIRHIRENYSETRIIMITGFATIEGAVESIKTGAEEYLAKPFTDDELFISVEKVLANKNKKTVLNGNGKYSEIYAGYGLLANSDSMNDVFRTIKKVASSFANILITGESGTGKELVARAIHYSSNRSTAPFVPVNCGGIPETLLESELFGYVKGAFTGARETRAGFFQTADGGTIFLDEISETSNAMQVKLLRVLQEKEVCMVGANRQIKVDIRILAATNKDLSESVKTGAFREDLFFRLNVININLPPLREREGDILILANHFAQKYAKECGRVTPHFSEKAMDTLLNYSWPGNVRELQNVIQRLVLLSEGDIIDVPDFPSLMRYSIKKELGINKTLKQVETEYIRTVLESVNGNKSAAAKILGIDRKTLRDNLGEE